MKSTGFNEEIKLRRKNDYKVGWIDLSVDSLFVRLVEECRKLQNAIIWDSVAKSDDPWSIYQAADVANVAMMIADR
ncbi:hypothetical protein B7C51_24725 (plasmid) [Paenibacillus larvae subsp. pulvifaciens]|uniref:Uncharacterized protein n=1 Tax=Paenibacillus larvae subsp. pulvifaciens TaxID=1477 RepID=A0A1V0UZL5_9BACL|nr:hypothetical protein [Paenibacillus larvae]ARF70682.1 hypothetical protein B7C51_24725 [Paenibacillus larvae subsp. pulvifaciens]